MPTVDSVHRLLYTEDGAEGVYFARVMAVEPTYVLCEFYGGSMDGRLCPAGGLFRRWVSVGVFTDAGNPGLLPEGMCLP